MGLGDLFLASFMPVLKLLLLSFVGSLLAIDRVDILGQDARKYLNNIVFYVFSPALIGVYLAKTITFDSIISLWFMPVNVLITFIIGSAFGWIVNKVTGVPSKFRGLIVGCCSAGNLGNLLIIIVPAVCKEKGSPFGASDTCYTYGMAYASLSMALGSVYIWLYVYNIMRIYSYEKTTGLKVNVPIESTESFGETSKPHLESYKEPLLALQNISISKESEKELAVPPGNSNKIWKVPFWVKFKQNLKILDEKVNFKRLFAPSTIAAIIGFVVGVVPQIRRLVIGDTAPLRVIEDSTSLLSGDPGAYTIHLGLDNEMQGRSSVYPSHEKKASAARDISLELNHRVAVPSEMCSGKGNQTRTRPKGRSEHPKSLTTEEFMHFKRRRAAKLVTEFGGDDFDLVWMEQFLGLLGSGNTVPVGEALQM